MREYTELSECVDTSNSAYCIEWEHTKQYQGFIHIELAIIVSLVFMFATAFFFFYVLKR